MKRIVQLTLIFIMIFTLAVPAASVSAAPPRPYNYMNYALELDGDFVQMIKGFTGGYPKGLVVGNMTEQSKFAEKSIGGLISDEINIHVSVSLADPLKEWITEMSQGTSQPHDGAIVFIDGNMKEKKRLEFTNAYITKVTFPEAIGGSKNVAYLEISLLADSTRFVNGSGARYNTGTTSMGAKNAILGSSKLAISEIGNVAAIHMEPLVFSQEIAEESMGELKFNEKLPTGKFEISNLELQLSEAALAPFLTWYEDFLIQGNNADNKERTATLQYMTQDLKTTLLTLQLKNVGIFGIEYQASTTGTDQGYYLVEMYAETIDIK